MFFTADQIRTLTEQNLVEFLDRRISESTGVIDYKLALPGNKGGDREKTELLKDVSAFANAEGGHLLIGANEPTQENQGREFLVGIENGEQVATQIEQRCADCIDPRIPGLIARAIPLGNKKSAVVVHVPPSPSRPHMVIYEGTKTRTFFIRHSETVQPMKSSEVRQAVLSAAAGNQSAVEYTAWQEKRFQELYIKGRCAILVHATPLVPVEVLWNVTDDEWRQVMDGSHRQHKRDHINLNGYYRQPSVEGIVAIDKEEDPELIYEVHRTGYVGAALLVQPRMNREVPKGPYFWGSHSQLFLAFSDLCEEAVQTARSDRPYLLQATITNAETAVLEFSKNSSNISKPLQRNELRFPQLRRDSGQSFLEAVEPWTAIFYNAFGVYYSG
jgi:hypothetical protein